MNLRKSSASLICAALAFAAAPLLSLADTTDTNAAPAAPTAPSSPAPADTTPAPSAAPTTPPAPTPPPPAPAPADTGTTTNPTTYTVVHGDSLWSIAHKFGTTVVKLRKANKLAKGALLHPGQVLQIPPAT